MIQRSLVSLSVSQLVTLTMESSLSEKLNRECLNSQTIQDKCFTMLWYCKIGRSGITRLKFDYRLGICELSLLVDAGDNGDR